MIDCGRGGSGHTVLPDLKALDSLGVPLRAVFFSHGHEDHIGAREALIRRFPTLSCHGSRETRCFIETRHPSPLYRGRFDLLQHGVSVTAGAFQVTPFSVPHSLPGAMGFVLKVAGFTLVHSGDFYLGTKSCPPALDGLKEIVRQKPVDLLLVDGTGLTNPGRDLEEREVAEQIKHIAGLVPGRVFATLFSSHIQRMAAFAEAAAAGARPLYVEGASLEQACSIAADLGMPFAGRANREQRLERGADFPERALVLLAGCQGENGSAFQRLVESGCIRGEDGFVYGARIIPGHWSRVSALLDQVARNTRRLWLGRSGGVHASGHAAAPEIQTLVKSLSPRFVLPVHAPTHYLVQAQRLLEADGYEQGRILTATTGQVLELSRSGARFVRDTALPEQATRVLEEERRVLGELGFAVIVLPRQGTRLGRVSITTRGFLQAEERGDFLQTLADQLEGTAQNEIHEGRASNRQLRAALQREALAMFEHEFGAAPWVLCHILSFP